MTTAAPEPEAPLDGAFVLPKRPLWPVFLVLAVALGAGGVFVYRWLRAPEPLRVLVAIDFDGYWWQGSEPAAHLADAVGARLAALGFDPVKTGDRAVATALEHVTSPEEAAAKTKAAFLITAHLQPEVVEHPIDGGYFELRVDATLTTRHVADEAGKQARVRRFTGAKDRKVAQTLLADALVDETLDAALAVLGTHPTILALFQDKADPALASRIMPARNYLAARAKALERVASAYAELAKTHADGERGPVPVTYHGTFSAQDLLCGAGPEGFLTSTSDLRPFFSAPGAPDVWIEMLETVEWRQPGGAARQLWAGYHVMNYAGAAAEGAPVVLIEDFYGYAKAVTVIDAAGKSRRARIDKSHRFVDPKVAPGGKAVALYDRACQSCPAGLLVMDLDTGRELFSVDAASGTFGSYTWLDARRLAYVHVPSGTERSALRVVDVRAQPPSPQTLLEGKDEGFAFPSASADGKRIALQLARFGPEQLGVVDVGTRELVRYDVQGYVFWPTFSPDGATLVFARKNGEQQRSDEVATLEPASGRVRVLTQNTFEEWYPRFSQDGRRIYFESRDRDPVQPQRGVSVVASVPWGPP